MSRAVDVTADLTVTVEGQPISVEAYTDTILVDLPSVRAGIAILRTEAGRLRRIDRTLREFDLTLVVLVDGTAVARVGARADPQVERLGPVELVGGGLLRAAVAAPIRFFN